MRFCLDQWVAEQQGRHFCACGCGGVIRIQRHHHARGIPSFIDGHVSRVRNPMRGKRTTQNPNFSGGRYVDRQGYVYVLNPRRTSHQDRYVYEHRLVMEQHLSRSLTSDEQVHHRNGRRADNRIENLQLVTAGEHARLHQDQLRRALGDAMYRRAKWRMGRGLPYRELMLCSAS